MRFLGLGARPATGIAVVALLVAAGTGLWVAGWLSPQDQAADVPLASSSEKAADAAAPVSDTASPDLDRADTAVAVVPSDAPAASASEARADTGAATIEADQVPPAEIIAMAPEPAKAARAEAAADFPTAPSVLPADPDAGDVPAPRFDVVQVDAAGAALVAGVAQPDASVDVVVDGARLGTATAGRDGRFVAFLDLGPSETPRTLTLEAEQGAGARVTSTEQVVVAPSPSGRSGTAGTSSGTATASLAASGAGTSDAASGAAMTETDAAAAAEDSEAALAAASPSSAPGAAPVHSAAEAAANPAAGTAPDAEPAPAADADAGDAAESPRASAPEVLPDDDAAIVGDATALPPVKVGARDPATEVQPAPVNAAGTARDGTDVPAGAASAGPAETGPVTAEAPELAPPPTVLLADNSGVRVLQDNRPEVMDHVAIDTISYSEEGQVALAGRGSVGGKSVTIYVNGSPVETTAIAADGSWRSDLPGVDTGTYTLRVDETDATGKVTSRIETPFRREDRADAAEAVSKGVTQVVVQPGYTLWAIARRNYGEGVLYVRVFEANKDQIRDPDLIYPGQIFSVPQPE